MAAIASAACAVTTAREHHGHRLAWLDALRGFAAMLVVYEHLTHAYFHAVRVAIERWFLAGYAGVCLFFVVSGYIIPASLERRDLRDFWIGRVFRLYPLYLAALALVFVLHATGLRPLDPFAAERPGTTALAHATMMSTLLGVPDLLGVTWTLAFEMVFYLTVAGLRAARLGGASPWVAVTLAVTSYVATPLPLERLSRSGGAALVVALGAVALAASVYAMTTRRRAIVVAGALLGVVLSAALLGWNQNAAHVGDGLLIPALMFTGTTVHRVEHGRLARPWVVVVPVVVFGAWCLELRRDAPVLVAPVAITLLVVAIAFAGGWLVRARRIPDSLAWLGLVSYSVYLLHRALFDVVLPKTPSAEPLLVQAVRSAALVAVVLAASAITYRFVERPGQRMGEEIRRRSRPK